MIRRFAVIAVSGAVLAGCNGYQNAMGGDGAESANFVQLFWVFMVVCTVMYLIVAVALLAAIWHNRRSVLTVDDRTHHQMSPAIRPALMGWTALVVAGLTVLTVASFLTDRSNAAAASRPALHMTVTANQWWWDVEYNLPDVSKTLRTANEIHLPMNVPVHVTLKSNDVIHSFWIPNLAGKQDLIPGRLTDVQLLARRTGLYRGQCAEFCGVQHAQMALDVTVESKSDFERWYSAQLATAKPPATPLQLAGYRYFNTRECGACHNIGGTPATGQVAPDLTHFASRRSIAAGALPMNKGNLYGWIADPQSQKPGSKMPTVGLEPNELHALVAYLETLK
jgi:cytochrome c oxidase subunit II